MPKKKEEPSEWMSVTEAAEEIGVDPRYIRGLCADGDPRLESMQVGRAHVIKRTSVEAFERMPAGRGIPGGAPKAKRKKKA